MPLARALIFPGGFIGGATPDPIPNSAVKSSRADDTTIGGKVGRCQGFIFLACLLSFESRQVFFCSHHAMVRKHLSVAVAAAVAAGQRKSEAELSQSRLQRNRIRSLFDCCLS